MKCVYPLPVNLTVNGLDELWKRWYDMTWILWSR